MKLYFRVIPLAALIGRWVKNLQTNQSEYCEFLFRVWGECVRQGAGSISQLFHISHPLILSWRDIHLWQVVLIQLWSACNLLNSQRSVYSSCQQVQLKDRLLWGRVWWEPLLLPWGFSLAKKFKIATEYIFPGATKLCWPAESSINWQRSCSGFHQRLNSCLPCVS